MKNVIQITDKILGVIVPSDAYDFEFIHNKTRVGYKIDHRLSYIDLPKGNFKIHGICTLPAFDFDFEVDESWVKHGINACNFTTGYFDYNIKDFSEKMNNLLDTKEQSFRTRIQKAIYDAGLLLINPIDIKGQTFSNEHQNKWQESESKVIRGKLLIIEKI